MIRALRFIGDLFYASANALAWALSFGSALRSSLHKYAPCAACSASGNVRCIRHGRGAA